MTISNFGAAGVKPGVCTSTTRPTTPYNGQVIYETDTDRALVWDGTAWEYLATGTPNPVGLELVATNTFTNSTNMLMNNCFSSAYDNYSVNINITAFSAATSVFMRMANGTTVDAGSIYLFGGFVSYMGSAILTAVNSGGVTTDWNLGAQEGTWGYGNTPFKVEVMQPFMTNRTSIFSSGFQPVNPQPYYRHIGGVTSNTTSYNGFTIIPNSVSFNLSGTISVYGYKK